MIKTVSQDRVDEATVRIGGTPAIPAVLKSLGADPAEVLAAAGIDPRLFDHDDNRISFTARGRLLAHCAARTGCPHFGLLLGQRCGLQELGLVGLLVKYSPTVGAALRNLVHYLHLHVRGASTTLSIGAGAATLAYTVYVPNCAGVEQSADGALAQMFNVMRSLCGSDWSPAEVRFAHRSPDDAGPYRRHFRAPLKFDAEQYAILFSSDWLERKLASDDPQLRDLLQQQIDLLAARHGNNLPGQVRSMLQTGLLTGHASASQIAALFSMHSRTLHRRLGSFGTSFRVLADEVRFQLARQMLATSTLGVREIAQTLDYADASAFTRAFRRWTGRTPAQWRRQPDGAESPGQLSATELGG